MICSLLNELCEEVETAVTKQLDVLGRTKDTHRLIRLQPAGQDDVTKDLEFDRLGQKNAERDVDD
jgi:hypothetical protein